MKNQKGSSTLILLILILFSLLAIVFLYFQGIIKLSIPGASQNVSTTYQQAPTEAPQNTKQSSTSGQTNYQNPLDKDTQYSNPFSGYENPFNNLK